MSNRKLTFQGFFRKGGRLYRKITKSFVNRVLRYVLLYQRRGKLSTSGFILPTTVLLILVVALTVGALTFRAYNRNVQVIGEAQQRVIYNAATPAIDRARSKLEFLFDATKDTRLPSGIPSQATLEAMLLNNDTMPRSTKPGGEAFAQLPYKDASGNQVDAYTFPDETRIDINKDGKVDNAWYFRTDTNGDGKLDTQDSTVVYSIVLNTPLPDLANSSAGTPAKSIATKMLEETDDAVKAGNRWVRQAPLSVDGALGCARNSGGGNAGPEGWFEDKTTTSKLRKNFQVDALVIPGNAGGTKATLEFTQDRELDRGNKWGAWFRHDLEIYPGADFRWNGAMHTEGNLIIGAGLKADGAPEPQDKFTAYLISSPSSCLFTPSASEISVTDRREGKDDLLGLVVAGAMQDGQSNTNDSSTIHLHSNTPDNGNSQVKLTSTTDNVSDEAGQDLYRITTDPEAVLLENGYTNVPVAANISNQDRNNRVKNVNPAKQNLPDLKRGSLPQRVVIEKADAPYVDDLYRADNLWGPKPKYGSEPNKIVPDGKYGQPIDSGNTVMLNDTVAPDDAEASGVGLDGYWERRARVTGLRLLVGQRLELGNLFTWYAPRNPNGDNYVANSSATVDQDTYEHEGDPLYPVTVKPYPVTPTGQLSHVDLHRRSLRDNLSAVQSTAVYHSAEDLDYPVACLATTSHPGTVWSLRQTVTFRPSEFFGTNDSGVADTTATSLLTNFFTGVGTNGWEFTTPGGDYSGFLTAVQNETGSLRLALQNLANFAGDHQMIGSVLKSGAFPPTPNAAEIHPYPALSMWGDYSNLKRALANLKAANNDFTKLSIADRTYIQTASCTLGMLAYNIDRIQKFDPSAINGLNAPNDIDMGSRGNNRQRLMAKLGRDLWRLMDGVNDGATSSNPEVLPREQLATYDYSVAGNRRANLYNPKDYQGVTPEALIGALRQYLLTRGTATNGDNLRPDHPEFVAEMRLAETIMLNHQIRRDRTYGFKPSPRFGQYTVFPGGMNNPITMPTACDPDQFVFTGGLDGDTDLRTGMSADPVLSRSSTTLSASGLAPVSLPTDPRDYNTVFPSSRGSNGLKRDLAYYRFALSKLCGTLDESGTQVLPKFPALYYLFPEVDHDYNGEGSTDGFDHAQPTTEPYIADSYVASIQAEFKRISSTKATGRAGHPSVSFTLPICPPNTNTPVCNAYNDLSRKPDDRNPASPTGESVRVIPIEDYSVSSIALTPRPTTMMDWDLPTNSSPRSFATKANFSTNIILKADSPTGSLTRVAVPFLDRAFFDGRQLMLVRTLDVDLGMLRSSQVGSKTAVWLPQSGIVYAFREDAVREDAISRPACTTTGCEMDLRDPANPKDPKVRPVNPAPPRTTQSDLNSGENGISTKSVDRFPDPDRRMHGFRLRNGMQLKRNDSLEGTAINAADNIKGLSFFTDQPVYIQGDFNHHQDGDDDTTGNRLEEFDGTVAAQLLNDDYSNFYTRNRPDPNFAAPNRDRWRPSEILADSITILSNGFCDGSIADTFVRYNRDTNTDVIGNGFSLGGTARYPVPDSFPVSVTNLTDTNRKRDYYHENSGLFDPGCADAINTSFHNQNRPAQQILAKTAGNRDGWTWVRENSRYDAIAERRGDINASNPNTTQHFVDITAPIKISRSGQPLVVRARDITAGDSNTPGVREKPLPPVAFNVLFPERAYYGYGQDVGENSVYASYGTTDGMREPNLLNALETRVNSIIVSGINPSRSKQGYGGLHNFPRFLEDWDSKQLFFSGSLIQLSYANYATSPFELENIEPSLSSWGANLASDPDKQNIPYYRAPKRSWGYDVGLQFSPASPAAARFVSASKNRSEYYVEPPASDPYIANLCNAAKSALNLNTSCPSK
ncbi:hypothetical protein H6F51_08875 [Cyanobacteria bacterium FACHB-DQ100]|nr:hypothetical protein [Cyanobacteria bacterium FACHB-DQ100]